MSTHVKADVILVVASLLAAAGWVFSREAVQGLPPIWFMGARFLIAGGILLMFAWPHLGHFSRSQWRQSGLIGLVFSSVMLCWILGLFYAQHVGVGAFLTSLGVLMVPIVARILGDRPPRVVWFALLLGGAGMALLSLDGDFVFGKGEYLFLTSAALLAVYLNLNAKAATRVPVIGLSAIQLLVVGGTLLPISALTEVWPVDVSWSIWMWLAASAILATSLRFFLQTWAQGMAPASHTAVIMTLEPVWAAFLLAWWLGEVMTVSQVIGCSLIFMAVLTTRYKAILALFGGSHRQRL